MSDEPRFDVVVFNLDGDMIERHRDATATKASEVQERYADEPFYLVSVEEM